MADCDCDCDIDDPIDDVPERPVCRFCGSAEDERDDAGRLVPCCRAAAAAMEEV